MPKRLLLPFCFVVTTILFSCKSQPGKISWQKTKIGTMGLSVETPFTFMEKDIQVQLTPAIRKLVKKMETYVNEEKGNYYVINMAEYTGDVNFSIDGAVNGALAEMRLKTGGQISNRTDETKDINGNQASLTSATISDKNDNKMEVQMAIINKDSRMYQVMGLYKQTSEEARLNTARLVKSIRIN